MKRLELIEPEVLWMILLVSGFLAACYTAAFRGRAESAPLLGSLIAFATPQLLLFSRARDNTFKPYTKLTYLVVNECFALAMAMVVAIAFWAFIAPL